LWGWCFVVFFGVVCWVLCRVVVCGGVWGGGGGGVKYPKCCTKASFSRRA